MKPGESPPLSPELKLAFLHGFHYGLSVAQDISELLSGPDERARAEQLIHITTTVLVEEFGHADRN